MIHLDTNILIALPHLVQQNHPLIACIGNGEQAAASMPVWHEFLIGPVSEGEIELAKHFVRSDIPAASADDAALAAQLFNAHGRKRSLKTDALIAAIAIRAKAELLTLNVADFKPFVRDGLRLFGTD